MLMNKQEEIIYYKVLEVRKETKGMNVPDFQTFCCMIAEFYCKDNNIDIRDFIDEIHATVYAINDEFGKF